MSHAQEPSIADDELATTATAGYKVGEKKTLDEYTKLDAEDESLARWKASLGIGASGAAADPSAPKLTLHSLSLESATAPGGRVSINLQQSKEQLAQLKSSPINVKEGVDYSVRITFSVGHEILSGLKYVQVAKRAGIKVDKLEEMIGSYGPRAEPYEKTFASNEAPSGMMARGTYSVRSRVVDDDGNVFADWDWAFKISKDW
ncbi:putative rho GDP dissociation inhibitor [Testicularia cyperi]|uniref:Rho GDP-dissociation inhibitor n=1 Tax=Testicularia cyperi TaxID=1882483 RepID=A0A317XVU1_9BASI|nr:putative rho GDP dissociation inhibitor [Testicularia cyperi]